MNAQTLEQGLKLVSAGQLQVAEDSNGAVATFALPATSGSERVLQVDRLRERVLFYGTPTQIQMWQRAVTALDQPRDDNGDAMHVVPVRNADPERLRLAVATLRGETGDTDEATAVNGPPQWGGRLVTRIFQENNQAGGAQPPPGGTPADMAAELGGLIGSVQIEYLEGLDVILLRGRPADVARVQQIIADIERISQITQPVVEVYHLQHVNGAVLATLLNELYEEEEFLSARQGHVSIRALVDPNALLLIGREESVAVVKNLILQLDKPAPPASQFQVFRLKHVSALDAETTIRDFFVTRPPDTEPRTGIGIQVQVLADYRSNSLICPG